MATTGGVSGSALILSTAGAVLVYAGIKDVGPLEVLRSLSKGKLPTGPGSPAAGAAVQRTAGIIASFTGGGGTTAGTATGTGPHPEFVAASSRFTGDQYSQFKRNRDGYSDCSSFVAKSMEACGVAGTKLAGNYRTTGTFMGWKLVERISAEEAGAGDFAISTLHMVMLTGTGGDQAPAIGQQNPSSDVRTGTVAALMTNGGRYKFYRYTGSSSGGRVAI